MNLKYLTIIQHMSTELFIKDKKNKRLREAWDERENYTRSSFLPSGTKFGSEQRALGSGRGP